MEVTLNLIASLGQLPGLIQELNSSTLCSVGQVSRLRKIISTTAPSVGTLRAHNLSFKRFCYGVPIENFHRASVFSKRPISTLPISWKSWQPSVLRCQNPQHRVWLGGSNSWMCLLHFHSQRVSSWPRSNLLAKTTMLRVLFRQTLPTLPHASS